MAQQINGSELDKFVARICKVTFCNDGKIKSSTEVGTGFLTVFPWLVTCNHVVASCIDGWNGYKEIKAGEIDSLRVEFPTHPDYYGQLFQASLHISKPKITNANLDSIEDIAILKLEISQPNLGYDNRCAPLRYNLASDDLLSNQIMVKGFHIKQGDVIYGHTHGITVTGRISIVFTEKDQKINGASGAPVWSKEANGIIGMLASQRGEEAPNFRLNRSYMIPIQKVLDACSEHREIFLNYSSKKHHLEEFRDCKEAWCPSMVVVAPSIQSQQRTYASPLIAVSKDPITVEQFAALKMKMPVKTVSRMLTEDNGLVPMTSITRQQCNEWLRHVNESLKALYPNSTIPPYRLLTELEWSYCCLCGGNGNYFVDSNLVGQLTKGDAIYQFAEANFDGERYDPRHVITTPRKVCHEYNKQNTFKLRGMHGNVWEMVCDQNDESLTKLKGGSYSSPPQELSARYSKPMRSAGRDIGFRVCRNLSINELKGK
jgi:hypothetical protein